MGSHTLMYNIYLGMAGQYIKVMLLKVAVIGFTMDTDCPKYNPDKPCIKTLHSVVVQSSDSLILNCTCFDKTNSQWTGPNKHIPTVPSTYIPYSQGTELNPRLNKSKYMVLGGYDVHKCNLKITNVLPDDDGTYMCQYINSKTMHIDVYNIVATKQMGDTSSVNHDGTNTKTETYTFETNHCKCNSRILNSSIWQLIGSLFGGLLIFSICLNIYCLLKQRKTSNSRRVSEIPLEIQYFEIGSIIDNIASIHDVPNNMQESVHDVDGEALENASSIISSPEKENSSDSSVHSLSNTQMDLDDYENPYQMIDLENIQPHLYSIIGSNLYQNTIIFQEEIRSKQTEHYIQHFKERDPWLIIYRNSSVNTYKCIGSV